MWEYIVLGLAHLYCSSCVPAVWVLGEVTIYKFSCIRIIFKWYKFY